MTDCGLAHIRSRHGAAFAAAGVTDEELPAFVVRAVTDGEPTGLSVGHGRPVHWVTLGRRRLAIAVTVADSGYVVSAHPESPQRIADPAGWPAGTPWRPATVTLLAEWGAGPLWVEFRAGDASVVANYLPGQLDAILRLPDDLLLDMAAWDGQFQQLLDQQYPPDSTFADEGAALMFPRAGHSLAKRLRAACPPAVEIRFAQNFTDNTVVVS
jgi:hypothetical protein